MVTGTIGTWIEANQQEISRVVVPAGATGVLLNVTAVLPTGAGFISVRPGDATGAPSTSNLNVAPGDIVPNQVTVAIPTSGVNKGKIDITYGSAPNNTVDIVVDVVGYTTNTGLIDLVNRVEQLETVSPARVIWVADDNTGDYASLSEALDAIDRRDIVEAVCDQNRTRRATPKPATVALKNYVDVEGSGQNTTTINCACSSNNFDASSAVISAGAITAEIRHLTINNTGAQRLRLWGVHEWCGRRIVLDASRDRHRHHPRRHRKLRRVQRFVVADDEQCDRHRHRQRDNTGVGNFVVRRR